MQNFDVIIIGSGSGNSLLGPEYESLKVAIIDGGIFGGTCLNVGCIPTKMYVYPAEIAQSARELAPLGVNIADGAISADWAQIRDRIFGKIDPISQGGLDYRKSMPNVTVFEEYAHFVAPKTLQTDSGHQLTAPTIVIASGSRVSTPRIPGGDLEQVHTSDTIMRLPKAPERIVIIGGGYIAAEFAHVFHGLGVQVTQISRSARLLRGQDDQIAQQFQQCAQQQWELAAGWTPEAIIAREDGSVVVHSRATEGEQSRQDLADVVLMATGRRPNSDLLNPEAAGIAVDEHTGLLSVDQYQRVLDGSGNVIDGLWALGDICSPAQLKHVANHEARVVAHNVIHPDDLMATDHRFIPAAIFTHPEIATVGMTEEQAHEWAGHNGEKITIATQAFGDVAYGWAMEDRTGLCKVIADQRSGQLLGAHLIGPHASILIQPLIQAMSFGLDVRKMAREQYWIHPALTEVVENALLGLTFD